VCALLVIVVLVSAHFRDAADGQQVVRMLLWIVLPQIAARKKSLSARDGRPSPHSILGEASLSRHKHKYYDDDDDEEYHPYMHLDQYLLFGSIRVARAVPCLRSVLARADRAGF